MSDNSDYVLPSNPEDRKKIKSVLQDISAQHQMIKDRKEFIKDAIDGIHEKYSIPKKIVAKLAMTLFKHNYDKVSEESEIFKLFYEEVIDKTQVPQTLLEDDDEPPVMGAGGGNSPMPTEEDEAAFAEILARRKEQGN